MNTPPKHVDALLQAYFSGNATQEQAQTLEAWLRESSSNVRWFVDLALLDGLMLSVQKDEDAAAVLTILRESEEQAEPDFSLLTKTPYAEVRDDPADRPVTLHELGSLGGYALGKALRSKAGVIGSIAALLFFAAVLGLLLIVGNTPTTSTDPTPRLSQAIVATLTAEHDAQWERRPGEDLYAGQRFMLTQGFAEITTRRGAVAILQAPTEIEFTDSDNAIRLHRGKLFGRCLTPASKGMVVHTPNAQIVDLGTEFGLDLAAEGTLQAHVLDGEVTLAPITGNGVGPAIMLEGGDALQVSKDASEVRPIQMQPYRFVRGMSEKERDPLRGYVAAVIAQNPIIYYRFESIGSNGRVVNEVGDRYHARVVDRVSMSDTGSGYAAQFVGGYIALENSPKELADAEAYTIECWVQPRRVHDGSIVAFIAEPGVSDEIEPVAGGLSIHRLDDRPGLADQSQRLRFFHRNPPSSAIHRGTRVMSGQPYAIDRWMHVAAVKDGAEMQLYINGDLHSRGVDETHFFNGNVVTRIGANVLNGSADERRHFDGVIDEFAIYDRALSADQIKKHYTLNDEARRATEP